MPRLEGRVWHRLLFPYPMSSAHGDRVVVGTGQRVTESYRCCREWSSSSLVRCNGFCDLVSVLPGIGPRVAQILRPQRRVAGQQLGLRDAKTARLLQDPHRDPGPHDPGVSTADIGGFVDPRRTAAQVLSDLLQYLGLFAGKKLRKHLVDDS
jgi:hypothetical protein